MESNLAAGNNADWCDLVCRAHGVDTRRDDNVWVAQRRSPQGYPDAVTLRPDGRPDDLLPRVDSSPGCSVKDSFAAIDLSTEGFRILFEAEWIHREPAPPNPGGLDWSEVRTARELEVWGRAHGGGDVFHRALLANPAVGILAARTGGTVVAGVIGNQSAGVVGVSNLFTTIADPDRVWAGAIGAVSARFPGRPLVGYEGGASLLAAHRAGFVSVGPLRVWLKA